MKQKITLTRTDITKILNILDENTGIDKATIVSDHSSGIGQTIEVEVHIENSKKIVYDITEYDKW